MFWLLDCSANWTHILRIRVSPPSSNPRNSSHRRIPAAAAVKVHGDGDGRHTPLFKGTQWGGREGGRRMKSNAADGFKRFITTAKAGKFRGSCVCKVSSRTMIVVVFGKMED